MVEFQRANVFLSDQVRLTQARCEQQEENMQFLLPADLHDRLLACEHHLMELRTAVRGMDELHGRWIQALTTLE